VSSSSHVSASVRSKRSRAIEGRRVRLRSSPVWGLFFGRSVLTDVCISHTKLKTSTELPRPPPRQLPSRSMSPTTRTTPDIPCWPTVDQRPRPSSVVNPRLARSLRPSTIATTVGETATSHRPLPPPAAGCLLGPRRTRSCSTFSEGRPRHSTMQSGNLQVLPAVVELGAACLRVATPCDRPSRMRRAFIISNNAMTGRMGRCYRLGMDGRRRLI
jgi:hypothetical protein